MKITKTQLKQIIKEELDGLLEYRQGHLSSDDPQWKSGWSLHDERQAESMWDFTIDEATPETKEKFKALEDSANEVIKSMVAPEFRSPGGDPKRTLSGPAPVYQALMSKLKPADYNWPAGIDKDVWDRVIENWRAKGF